MGYLAEFLASWLLERRIKRERIAVCTAKTVAEARQHAETMRELIACRSHHQVARMERRKGLA